MRCMHRNKSVFYYAAYIDKRPIIDGGGFDTGEYSLTYSKPIKCKANISAEKGETSVHVFGNDAAYDKTIIMDEPDFPINEQSVLWVDSMPITDRYGNLAVDEYGNPVTPNDYVVYKVARSINSLSVAIRKVTTNG